tara:strand:+ start:986 stop:1375 length:390 start_codon:yes stop_codon:yes gene_type:complete
MTKHLTLLLFIGLAWGQAETDTSQIDYYEKGVIAAKEDFSQYYSCFAGCTFNPVVSPASIIIPAIFLVYPVKLPQKHHSILNTENGKAFQIGYKEEAMNIKVKSVLAGLAFRQVAEFLKGVVFSSVPIG